MMHPQHLHQDQLRLNYPGRIRVFNNVPPSTNTNYLPPNPLPIPQQQQHRNKITFNNACYPPRPQLNNFPQMQMQKTVGKHYPSTDQSNRRNFNNAQGGDPKKRRHNQFAGDSSREPNKENKESVVPEIGACLNVSPEDLLGGEKIKTPMCLVNELARYNKITHQYRLTGEAGPAHKKKFTVTLMLGGEEYSAEGASIKKAQHLAAAEAQQKTKYSHPPPKLKNANLKANKKNPGNITPTVELNAFAMKQGLPVLYSHVDSSSHQSETSDEQDNVNTSLGLKRTDEKAKADMSHVKHSEICKVSLKVGFRTFVGIGNTPQAARHNAASRALQVMRSAKAESEEATSSSNNSTINSINNDLKSPISLVHEIALKHKLTVNFEVKQEKGPPHMKIFVTQCQVGDIITDGEANGKKLSRKKAAENMLEKLKNLSPTTVTTNNESVQGKNKKKIPSVKKKNRNLIKENVAPNPSEDINPISRLIQLAQSRKEKEPVYSLIDERGVARRREFVMEVELGGLTATGIGQNKKIAKKCAAIELLTKLGIVTETTEKNGNIKTIISPTASLSVETTTETEPIVVAEVVVDKKVLDDSCSQKPKESQEIKSIPTFSNLVKPKQQLLYLAEILDFTVEFSDFPKGNHGEYLTLVTLSTFPPQLCHGNGKTIEESSDNASFKALELLRELGLDIIKKPGSC